MSKLVIEIVRDDDHTAHIWSDIDRFGDDDNGKAGERWREEIDKIDSGEWSAYGVTVARVCECCNQIEEQYVTSLWGCVVETHGAEGRYDDLATIPDDYLREVASEVMEEAMES